MKRDAIILLYDHWLMRQKDGLTPLEIIGTNPNHRIHTKKVWRKAAVTSNHKESSSESDAEESSTASGSSDSETSSTDDDEDYQRRQDSDHCQSESEVQDVIETDQQDQDSLNGPGPGDPQMAEGEGLPVSTNDGPSRGNRKQVKSLIIHSGKGSSTGVKGATAEKNRDQGIDKGPGRLPWKRPAEPKGADTRGAKAGKRKASISNFSSPSTDALPVDGNQVPTSGSESEMETPKRNNRKRGKCKSKKAVGEENSMPTMREPVQQAKADAAKRKGTQKRKVNGEPASAGDGLTSTNASQPSKSAKAEPPVRTKSKQVGRPAANTIPISSEGGNSLERSRGKKRKLVEDDVASESMPDVGPRQSKRRHTAQSKTLPVPEASFTSVTNRTDILFPWPI